MRYPPHDVASSNFHRGRVNPERGTAVRGVFFSIGTPRAARLWGVMSTHKDSFSDILDPTFRRIFHEELDRLPELFPGLEWSSVQPSRWLRFRQSVRRWLECLAS
jgi:hypothetical protein